MTNLNLLRWREAMARAYEVLAAEYRAGKFDHVYPNMHTVPLAIYTDLVVSGWKPEEVDPLVIVAREMTLLDGVIRTDGQKAAIRGGRAGNTASDDLYDRLKVALPATGYQIVRTEEQAKVQPADHDDPMDVAREVWSEASCYVDPIAYLARVLPPMRIADLKGVEP